MSVAYEWNGLAAVPLAAIALNIVVFTLIVRKSPDWVVSRIFMGMVVSAFGWGVGDLVVSLVPPDGVAEAGPTWGRFMWACSAVLVALTFQFALSASRDAAGSPAFRWYDAALYLAAASFVGLIFATDQVIAKLAAQPLRVSSPLEPTLGGAAFAVYDTALPVGALAVLFAARRRSKDDHARERFKWFIIGLSAPVVLGAMFSWLPLIGITNGGFPTFSLSVTMAMLLIGYGVVRYQLFDIKVRLYLRRALIVGFATGFALTVVLATATVVFARFGGFLAQYPAVVVVAAITPGIVLARLWDRLGTWTVESVWPSLKWKEGEIGDVFLVSNSGLLITRHTGASKLKVNERAMVSMLTAIQDFLATSLEGPDASPENRLSVLAYGGTKVLIEHGPECYMVVVFDGFETRAMRAEVRKTLRAIHSSHGPALREWDGGRWLGDTVNPIIGSMLGVGPSAPMTAA